MLHRHMVSKTLKPKKKKKKKEKKKFFCDVIASVLSSEIDWDNGVITTGIILQNRVLCKQEVDYCCYCWLTVGEVS